MILVDTSIWIDHFRKPEIELIDLLNNNQVLIHPFIIGEIAVGNLRNRSQILDLLGGLPQPRVCTDSKVLRLIENRSLMGRGIGIVDVHLLASTIFTEGTLFWSRDKRLNSVASEFGIAANHLAT